MSITVCTKPCLIAHCSCRDYYYNFDAILGECLKCNHLESEHHELTNQIPKVTICGWCQQKISTDVVRSMNHWQIECPNRPHKNKIKSSSNNVSIEKIKDVDCCVIL